MNDKLTEKIMYEVAKKERSDVFVSLFLLLPTIIALVFIAAVCSHKTLSNLSNKGFFDLIIEFEYDLNNFYPQIADLGNKLWEETVRGFLAASAASSTAAFFLLKKSKLTYLRTRVKEISKYFSETNSLIYRINK